MYRQVLVLKDNVRKKREEREGGREIEREARKERGLEGGRKGKREKINAVANTRGYLLTATAAFLLASKAPFLPPFLPVPTCFEKAGP